MRFSAGKWLAKFQKYLFYFKDGFYELPYVANSPELMVESFSVMPFVKNFPTKGYYTISNIFLTGIGHYHKVEDGLWLIMSDFEVKRNLSFKLYYESGVPAEYNFLTLYLNRGKHQVRSPKIHIDIENIDRSWTLFKAGSKALNTHFKGQKSIFLTIYFSNEWMSKNISSHGVLENQLLQQFFDSKDECLFLPNFLDEKKTTFENLVNSILDKDENGVRDKLMLKANTLEIMASFISKLNDATVSKVLISIPEKDKRAVIKAEYLLSKAIFGVFPSIGFIAKSVGVSETKLKSDFKSVYGLTLYQYYSMLQMRYARELLLNETISIKEVSYSLGFSNPGKFSAAFKKIYGVLPSQIR